MANKGIIKSGPVGGDGGIPWDFNMGDNAAINEIVINSGSLVDSITPTAINRQTKQVISTKKFGGDGGYQHTVSINWPEEYFTKISGTIAFVSYPTGPSFTVLESLAVHTNKKIYGPFGKTNGYKFEIPAENGEIVSFFGRAGSYIDGLGIYVKPSA